MFVVIHAHPVTSALLEGATQAIAAGFQSVRQRVGKKGKNCVPHYTAFTVRYGATVDEKRDRERGKKRVHITSGLFFCLSPFFPLSYPFSTGVSNGAVFACSCSEPLWTISVFTGVISYHSCVGEFRRVRCSKLPNDTAR